MVQGSYHDKPMIDINHWPYDMLMISYYLQGSRKPMVQGNLNEP